MKLINIMKTTDSNYIYNKVKKLYLIKFANNEAKEWLGWDKGMSVPNCSCSTCKHYRGKFTTKLKLNKSKRSWKEYRSNQWR